MHRSCSEEGRNVVTMNPQVLLTADGWRQLHDELAELRRRRAEALAANGNGGWSSPSNGAASPSEIEYLSHCIAELEYVLSRAVPVESDERKPGVVGVGSEVEVHWDDGSRETYAIVGPPEVEARRGRISYVSPVGLALMGRRAGDVVVVVAENQTSRIRVVAVR
jgi:transcription elongation factor GreA